MIVANLSMGLMSNLHIQKDRSLSSTHLNQYMKKQGTYITMFSVIYLFYLTSNYFMLSFLLSQMDVSSKAKPVPEEIVTSIWVMEATIFLMILQGVVLGVLRLNEPQYHAVTLAEIKTWFGIVPEKQDKAPASPYPMMQQ